MGQRLNIEIIKNGKAQANSYYHWSAYTGSAIALAKQCLLGAKYRKTKNPQKFAIRVLECTDAGITKDEKELLKKNSDFKNFRFSKCYGRNDGLISLSEEGMKETRDWQEGCVEIDFDKKMIRFDVFSYYESEEEIKEYSENMPDIVDMETPPYEWMTFDEFDSFVNTYRCDVFYRCGECFFTGIE